MQRRSDRPEPSCALGSSLVDNEQLAADLPTPPALAGVPKVDLWRWADLLKDVLEALGEEQLELELTKNVLPLLVK